MKLYKTFQSLSHIEKTFISVYVSDLEENVYLSIISFCRNIKASPKGYRYFYQLCRIPVHQSSMPNKKYCQSYLTARYINIEECKKKIFVDPSGALQKTK